MKSSSGDAKKDQLTVELFEDACDSFADGSPLYGIDYIQDHALSWLWSPAERVGSDFDEQRELFLWLIERLLREGRIKLHKNGVFLESSIEEQVDLFRRAFPISEAASGYEDFYWWFFDDECPAGVAWRQPDGGYQMAD